MAEELQQERAVAEAEAAPLDDFSALLRKEFKPNTEVREQRIELAVKTLAQQALADGIIVTPTLLRLLPSPVQRVIGNLSDTSQVLLTLGSE